MTCRGYLQKCLVRSLSMLPSQSSPKGRCILNNKGTLTYFHAASRLLAQLTSVLDYCLPGYYAVSAHEESPKFRRHYDPRQRRATTYRSIWRNITKDLKFKQHRWEDFVYLSFAERWFMIMVHHSDSACFLPSRCIIMTLETWNITVAVLCIELSETISFDMSARVECVSCHWTDGHEIWYLSIFQNMSGKFYFVKIWQ
jgi:hypothetical protein